MYAIIAWSFPIRHFLSVSPSATICIFAFQSFQLFCYVLLFDIFCSKIVLFPCHLVVGISSCNLLLLLVELFSLFWNDKFCLYYFRLFQYLFCLPSLTITLWFYIVVLYCLLNLCCFFFVVPTVQFCSFVLSFLLIVVYFLSAFPVEFPILILSFYSCFLGGNSFYYRQLSLPHKLICLIPWCWLLEMYYYYYHNFFFLELFNIVKSSWLLFTWGRYLES